MSRLELLTSASRTLRSSHLSYIPIVALAGRPNRARYRCANPRLNFLRGTERSTDELRPDIIFYHFFKDSSTLLGMTGEVDYCFPVAGLVSA